MLPRLSSFSVVLPNREFCLLRKLDKFVTRIGLTEAHRGKFLFAAVTKSRCNDLENKNYENVTIQL